MYSLINKIGLLCHYESNYRMLLGALSGCEGNTFCSIDASCQKSRAVDVTSESGYTRHHIARVDSTTLFADP